MHLLARLVDRFSRGGPSLRQAATELPLYLFDRSFSLTPLLRRQGARSARIRRCLEQKIAAADFCRDAEVYVPIFTLAESTDDEARVEELLRQIEFRLGISGFAGLKPGIYRLPWPNPRVVYLADGKMVEIEEARPLPMAGGRGIIYLPCGGLFNDLLPENLYPRIEDPVRRPELLRKLDFALDVLSADFPELFADLLETVSTVVLLPASRRPGDENEDREGDERWCFNLRLRYFGGVFLNLHRVGGYGALEGLVHEYCHQRLWLWWEMERPSGIPSPDRMMVSPVTGLNKPVGVMVHALVIYQMLCEIYLTRIDRRDDSPSEAEWLMRRHAKLKSGIPQLISGLEKRLPKGSSILALVQWISQRHTRDRLADGTVRSF